MSNFPVVRAKSSVCLPREREVQREGTVATLSRVTSVPNLGNFYVSGHYRPSSLFRHRLDRNSYDDYLHDRFTNSPSLYWADLRYSARRFATTDAIPNSGEFGYPGYHQRYKWYTDYLNPDYWRKYRDPYYDRPLWDSWKPYLYDNYNVKQGIKMYKQGLIPFGVLDKKWIEPWALGRRYKDWDDTYTKAGRYGPRRYFYKFAA